MALGPHVNGKAFVFSKLLRTRSHNSLMDNMSSYLAAAIIEISVSGLCPHASRPIHSICRIWPSLDRVVPGMK